MLDGQRQTQTQARGIIMTGAENQLGPLSSLLGVWEGEKGSDSAPDDDRGQVQHNRYRERMTFDPTGLVENHDQQLFGLRYATTA
jgi:hypothetical protein